MTQTQLTFYRKEISNTLMGDATLGNEKSTFSTSFSWVYYKSYRNFYCTTKEVNSCFFFKLLLFLHKMAALETNVESHIFFMLHGS